MPNSSGEFEGVFVVEFQRRVPILFPQEAVAGGQYSDIAAEKRLFRDRLNRCGKVHAPLGRQFVLLTWRSPGRGAELFVGHAEARATVAIALIQTKCPVGFQIKEMIDDQVLVFRLAIRANPMTTGLTVSCNDMAQLNHDP